MTRTRKYQEETLVACYLKHHSQIKAAEELGVSKNTVARAVLQAGLPLDGRKYNGGPGCGSPLKITDEQILASVGTMTRQEIADKYGVHVANLDRRMRRLGVHALRVPRAHTSTHTSHKPKRIFGECWHFSYSQKKWVEKMHPDYEYLESRKIKSGAKRIRLKCKCCGTVVERAESTVRQRGICCETCENEKLLSKQRVVLLDTLNAIAFAKTPKTCAHCGETFFSNYPTKLYCSEVCKRKAHRRRAKRIKTNKGHYSSRAKLYGALYVSGITREKVAERDGYVCQICGKTCNESDKTWGSFGPDYPTLDHIVPLSKGGTHTWENVQCACGICNSIKGANIEEVCNV